MSRIRGSRVAALHTELTGAAQAAIGRFLKHGDAIESRWRVARVTAVVGSVLLLTVARQPDTPEGLAISGGLALAFYLASWALADGLSTRGGERIAPWFILGLAPLELVAAPFALPFQIVRSLLRGNHQPKADAKLTETQVELVISRGERDGSLDHDQSEMIRNILDFGDRTAGDVMVPRTRVTAVNADMDREVLLALALEKGHSRYPVIRERIDNVVGILHVKDLLEHRESDAPLATEDVMRKNVVFVPEGQSASQVLRDMRAARQHLAIVLDEFGDMSGVVTMEDLLEEIVGDIQDEYDHEEAPIVDLGDGRLMVNAGVPISDLSRYLGIEFGDGDFHSLGGFIVERFGRVPEIDDELEALGHVFVVRDADERHVTRIEIVRPEPSPESAAVDGSTAAA